MSSEHIEQVLELISNSDFNWVDFLDHMMHHRLSGLIAKNIGKVPSIPVGISKILTQLAALNSEKGRLFISETEELFRIFKKQKLKVILFKGPRLVKDIYPEYSLRTFGDLDKWRRKYALGVIQQM